MTKKDYIDYWKTTALKDWEAVGHLFEKGDYLHALFFAHLVVEKLLKAHFVRCQTVDFPPKTHNLLILINETDLIPTTDQLRFLSLLNQFQIEGRYPDYKFAMFKIASEEYTKELLDEVQLIKQWLETNL